MIKKLLKEYSDCMEISLSQDVIDKFDLYNKMLLEWNKRINLTGITDPKDVAIKHFIDSISVLKFCNISKSAKLIDIGTGAGFPGVPLKMVREDINLTLLDSLNKRLVFLKELKQSLNIDAEIIHSRAEEGSLNTELRENFDVVISRAVAQLNLLAEYCIPYVKLGGIFISMKGANAEDEIKNAMNAISVLGGEITETNEFVLPDGSKRSIIVIKKIKQTNKEYPRYISKIKKNPL